MTISKDQELPWFRGGPLLEVSFLKDLRISRQDFIEQIFTGLKNLFLTVEMARTDIELAEVKEEFVRGYPRDEQDTLSIAVHSISIPAYVHFIEQKRKAYIRIQQISENLTNITFDFFGSVHDAPEWGQRGIRETDLPTFVELLKNLFDAFEFAVGTIGFEFDSKDLFLSDECWPSRDYDLSNLNKTLVETSDVTRFIYILVNKTYMQLTSLDPLPEFRKVEDNQKYLLFEWKGTLEVFLQ